MKTREPGQGRRFILPLILLAIAFLAVVALHTDGFGGRLWGDKSRTLAEDSQIAAFAPGQTRYSALLNKVILSGGSEGITAYNAKHELIWSCPFTMQEPRMLETDSYAAVLSLKGNSAVVCGAEGLIYSITTEYPILTGYLNEEGDLAVVTQQGAEQKILVYNAQGNLKLERVTSSSKDGQPMAAADWIRLRLNSPQPFLTQIDPPLTYERLKKEKIIRAAVPPIPWDPFFGMKFATQTGHMEFYSERLNSIGLPMATYHEPYEVPTAARLASGTAKHKYQFFSGRQRFFMQSMFTDDPVMAELSGGKPTGRINPVDAKVEGIVDGDKCEVFNERGHVVIEMRLDQAVPPGTVQVWFGWRKRQFDANEGAGSGMYSELLVPLGDNDTLDEAARYWYQCVSEDGAVGYILSGSSYSAMAGAWDTIWDCACDVRKVEA